jgi:hypothetical protein
MIRARIGLALGAVMAAAGCTTVEPLNIKDSSALSYTARAVYRLTPARAGLEVEVGQVRGRDTQQLDAGRTAELRGQQFAGPMTLDNVATLRHAHFVYNHLLFPTRPVEMEWFAGVSGLRLNWSTTPVNPAQPAVSERIGSWGPTAGLVGRWKISPQLALEARGSLMATLLGSPAFEGNRGASEIAFAFSPVPELRLRLGYAESSTRLERRDFQVDSSEVSFKTRGPTLGLAFEWR